eukprot:gnl/Chilomastix_cuspidata/4491.p1 GENE.gnl/Chilomastix_cuspidata/4491~~gnl/Chilomastix_cuspidata/4491.p1  ORF type:complete len:622 (+),score=250.33 gnl/Chilomastix_cuspidata/4491:442-2307(+)
MPPRSRTHTSAHTASTDEEFRPRRGIHNYEVPMSYSESSLTPVEFSTTDSAGPEPCLKCEEHLQRLTALGQENQKLAKEIEKLKTGVRVQKATLEAKDEAIERFERERQDFTTELNAAASMVATLQEAVEGERAESVRLRQLVGTLEEKVEELAPHAGQTVPHLREPADVFKDTITQLRERLREKDELLKTLRVSLDGTRLEAERERARLITQLEAARRTQAGNLLEEVAALRTNLERLERPIEVRADRRVEHLTQRVTHLEGKVSRRDSEVQRLERLREELTASLREKHDEVARAVATGQLFEEVLRQIVQATASFAAKRRAPAERGRGPLAQLAVPSGLLTAQPSTETTERVWALHAEIERELGAALDAFAVARAQNAELAQRAGLVGRLRQEKKLAARTTKKLRLDLKRAQKRAEDLVAEAAAQAERGEKLNKELRDSQSRYAALQSRFDRMQHAKAQSAQSSFQKRLAAELERAQQEGRLQRAKDIDTINGLNRRVSGLRSDLAKAQEQLHATSVELQRTAMSEHHAKTELRSLRLAVRGYDVAPYARRESPSPPPRADARPPTRESDGAPPTVQAEELYDLSDLSEHPDDPPPIPIAPSERIPSEGSDATQQGMSE